MTPESRNMGQAIFTREIIKGALNAIGQEMFAAQKRTSMSPVIYETLDFGIGITDAEGRLLTQGMGIPGFVGALDGAVRDVLDKFDRDGIQDGDVFITNDPYGGGGTHLSDVTLLKPVFFGERLVAWMANKAHWTELGGANPGSFSTSTTDVFQEGLQFPVVKLCRRGAVNTGLTDMLRANVRLPDMTLGDLWSGIAALRVGELRLVALLEKYGLDTTLGAADALLDHGEQMVREAFAHLPKGRFSARDRIDSDGLGNGPFDVAVEIRIDDSRFIADFSGTAGAAPGPINCTRPALMSAAREVFMGIVGADISANDGCFRALSVICPDNTVLTATRPAPTSSYFEAMVAAADVMRRALAPAMPGRLTAGQFGSVCSMVLSGNSPGGGEPYILVQPLVGGWGAGANKDGENAQFCVGNGETSNIPVEIQEARYGVRVNEYALHHANAGAGEFRGGLGAVLEYEISGEGVELSTFFGRGATPPDGIAAGMPGSVNYAMVLSGGEESGPLTMASRVALKPGDRVRLYTATGAGWGNPGKRSAQAVANDLRDGYISPAQAKRDFNCPGPG